MQASRNWSWWHKIFKPINLRSSARKIKADASYDQNSIEKLPKDCYDKAKSPVKLIHEIPLSSPGSNPVQSIQGLRKVREDWTAA